MPGHRMSVGGHLIPTVFISLSGRLFDALLSVLFTRYFVEKTFRSPFSSSAETRVCDYVRLPAYAILCKTRDIFFVSITILLLHYFN